MADAGMNWLRREAVIRTFQVTFTGPATEPLIPRDPMRFLTHIRGSGNADVYYGIGANLSDPLTIIARANGPDFIIHEDDWGDLVTLPMYWKMFGTGAMAVILTASYCPCHWSAYEQLGKQVLKQ